VDGTGSGFDIQWCETSTQVVLVKITQSWRGHGGESNKQRVSATVSFMLVSATGGRASSTKM